MTGGRSLKVRVLRRLWCGGEVRKWPCVPGGIWVGDAVALRLVGGVGAVKERGSTMDCWRG